MNRTLVIWSTRDTYPLAAAFGTFFSSADHRNRTSAAAVQRLLISIPPETADKTQLRPANITNHFKNAGPPGRINVLAEFQFGAWNQLRQARNLSWGDVGCMFRNRMDAAGYDVHHGDTWEINEAPHTLRVNHTFRMEFAQVLAAIACGCNGTHSHVPGVVLCAAVGQSDADVGPYKSMMKAFLQDSAFFKLITPSTLIFAHETYTSSLSTCVSSATPTEQLLDVSLFVNHVINLAQAGQQPNAPPEVRNATHAAFQFLREKYAPTMNAVWGGQISNGYGYTDIPLSEMVNVVSLQQTAYDVWFKEYNQRESGVFNHVHDFPTVPYPNSIPPPLFITFGFGGLNQRDNPHDVANFSERLVNDVWTLPNTAIESMCTSNNTAGPALCHCKVTNASLNLHWQQFLSWT